MGGKLGYWRSGGGATRIVYRLWDWYFGGGLDRWLHRFSCCLGLYLGLDPDFEPLLTCCLFSCISFFLFFVLVVYGFWPLISFSQLLVGLGDPGVCTMGALSGLVRRCAIDKWTLPSSGRMKCRAT